MSEINAEITEELIDTTKNFLLKMGIESNVRARIDFDSADNREVLRINIESEDGSLLIGQGGSHLVALQHLLRAIIKRKTGELFSFVVDVNNYRSERHDFLKQLAETSARRAATKKEEVVLRPMTSYERRLVHKTLSENDFVMTTSVGEEPERKVVIKPRERY
jgi:spoIIIJ-associated protein